MRDSVSDTHGGLAQRRHRWLRLAAALALLVGAAAPALARGYVPQGRCGPHERVQIDTVPAGHCVALVADEAQGLAAPRRILEVAPDYSWALIGYPGREMAWIFAREPDMDNATYRQLATRLRDKYDVNTDKLKRVPQHPQQVDKLGFEVPNKK